MTATTLPDTVRTQAFIDGEFTDALDHATFDSLAPATGTVIAQVAAGGEADVDRAVQAARAAFTRGDWSRMAPADRKNVLLRFADLIEAHGEELALVEAIDAGKPITDCRSLDLPDVLGTIRWYAETADKVFGKTSPTDADHLGLIVREPVGVVGGVLPWNFPMAMLAWKIGPALATGNSVVIKPPELASLTTLRMAELALEAGLPRGVFNVVPGLGHVAGRALGLHPDVDMITFTGSTEVGREFLRYSADSNLKGTVLEMGGKSPQIVMADCRDILDTVAADLAGAAFWAAGQNCSAGSRILVHSSIKDDFVSALAEQAERYRSIDRG
jgi:gamma-glutamyl-gamma-aminobutyraldehyde dehydrogenase